MYCSKCGKEIADEAVVCTGCGCAVHQTQPFASRQASAISESQNFINTISQRIQTNGIIWIVIAAVQLLLGLLADWTLLIVGALNLISSIQDINYSKSFPLNPVGIVAKMKPLTGPIITLIYNLIFGGVIGVIGSIYYFVAVRGYVLENEHAFLAIENSHNN